MSQLLSSRKAHDFDSRVKAALDGEASAELRRLINIEELRRDGVFFTSSSLRKFAMSGICHTFDDRSVIYDPTCGAGDLLLGAANILPLRKNLSTTLRLWSNTLQANDLHPELLEACKKRLTIAAWKRHGYSGRSETIANKEWFPGLQKACALTEPCGYQRATHIIMNPPFASRIAPDNCTWGSGSVNAAALFLEYALMSVNPGTRIMAILPEVIRCGSRYKKFRRMIEDNATVTRVRSYGLFDSQTDVDVFVLELTKPTQTKGRRQNIQWGRPVQKEDTIEDLFDVSVGPVVDFRDEKRGKWYPYLTADCVPPWGEIYDVGKRRRYRQRVIQGPFVVIRRTSRPDDEFRAVGTGIYKDCKFAVDNHLIVCKPHDGTIRSCKALLKLLKTDITNHWLNRVIRCRHLTVGAVKNIPWSQDV
ncbi:MAG: N-6 DNA methylase [Planctomycetota bacterium]